MIARIAYAGLFVVALPALLALWAVRLDAVIRLRAVEHPVLGALLAAAGALLMLAATFALWRHGQGLPASPFPPVRLVTRGVYSVLANPMYVGAVAVALGVSIASGSPAGVWVVTPTLALAATAFVLGFERDATRARYGRLGRPWLRLPDASDTPPTVRDRLGVVLLVLAPWLLFYLAIEFLGAPPDARSTYAAWEHAIPVIPWTSSLYAAVYIVVVLAPFVLRSNRVLRAFALDGRWATGLILPLYVLLPFVAVAKPVPAGSIWSAVMEWERSGDSPATAMPAFHLVWMLIAARAYGAEWPRSRWFWRALSGAVGVSCVTTGMHAVADVAAGAVVFAVVVHRGAIWGAVRRSAERVANSWREAEVAGLRFTNHGIYTGLGAGVGMYIATAAAGSVWMWWIAGMTAGAVVGAALWAQMVEGSPQLLRPFGYYGSVLGALAVLGVAAWFGAPAGTILAGFCVGAPFTQALGRVRCLIHGCCHGAPAPAGVGIVYTHPMPRVVRLGGLGGVPIHATQLYSAGWCLLAGAVLLRVWTLHAPVWIVVGMYFILTGLGRFVEEHFRGEPQTAEYGGLRLYQWFSIVFVVAGAAVTAAGGIPAPPMRLPGAGAIVVATVAAALAYLAYGADVPSSNRRFSRLR